MNPGSMVRRPFFAVAVTLALIASSATAPVSQAALPQKQPATTAAPIVQLFRTTVTLSHPTDRARLDKLGIKVLSAGTSEATVLVDDEQLATLARLRFEPRASDEFNSLVNRQARSAMRAPQSSSLSSLTDLTTILNSELASNQLTSADALTTLDAAVQALTPEQVTAISGMTSIDSDGDGLTDTQEGWWCTNPLNPDSDNDGDPDGSEVQKAMDWVGNRRAGPPDHGAPFLGWPMVPTDGHFNPNCVDADHDGVPDAAERWMLGLNPNKESTSGDKYDDGQKLFSITPPTWGALPRPEDAAFIGNNMPSWVLPPGNHPMAAAYPLPHIDIVQSSFTVKTVTTITTESTVSDSTEHSYSTAKTEGDSTSEADTVSWSDYQEATVGTSTTTPLGPATLKAFINLGTLLPQVDTNSILGAKIDADASMQNCALMANAGAASGAILGGSAAGAASGAACANIKVGEVNGVKADNVTLFGAFNLFHDIKLPDLNLLNNFNMNLCLFNCGVDKPDQDQQHTIDEGAKGYQGQDRSDLSGASNFRLSKDPITGAYNSAVIERFYPVTYPVQRPTVTQSKSSTSGHSVGGAKTSTTSHYQENTVTNGQQFGHTEGWNNATAINTAHAADFWFAYTVSNAGTDYMTSLCNLAFNVYIGDDPNPAYTYFVAPDLGGDGCFHNYQPGDQRTFSAKTQSHAIPLSLDQMKAIDLGEPVRVVVADYSFGSDQVFYSNARNADVLVAIKDDGQGSDSPVDNYLIPTWGDGDTMQDVIGRYFPSEQDVDGNYIAVWTPTNGNGATPSWCIEPKHYGTSPQVWCKHALSTADWWNIYLNNLGDGTSQLSQTPAAPNSTAFFRFNRDSDLDGYSDMTELALGTDPFNAANHPNPELIAGANKQPAVNGVVTGTISLLNTGLYDAYGVEIITVAPNDSITILNNTVGGSGRVKAGKSVIVGSTIKLPDTMPGQWSQAGHAQPALGGYYTGNDQRIYTFTALDSGSISTATMRLSWNDGLGVTGTLLYGVGYLSPEPLAVGAYGVKLGFLSGSISTGETFSMTARPSLDTFSYQINREPHTDPLFIVSYNDPQGNHRFIIPPGADNLISPTESLLPYSGQKLQDPGVTIATSAPFSATQAQTITLVVNNPSGVTLANAHLFVEFVNISGTVSAEFAVTRTLPSGPNVVDVPWNTGVFSPTFDAGQDYIVMAFFTDYQGNILDTQGRPLSSFQPDPKPVFTMNTADQDWDFGTATQGTLLKRTFTFGNVGLMNLLTYINGVPGLSLSQTGSRNVGPADATTYEMALNTSNLSVGPYDQTLTIRSSDPAQPTQTVHVHGTVTAGTPDATGGFSRPLDVDVTVTGTQTQGTWWTYSHTLGPNPDSLHPVKVYNDTYTTMWGVGKYATDFSAGTAPADMFGDGRDGPLTISSNTTDSPIDSACSGTAGSLYLASTNEGFSPGQAVWIHQTIGVNAGHWERNTIAGYTPGTITLATPLGSTYSTGAQVLVLHQYTNVTVSSGSTWTAKAWNGVVGGILAFIANGNVTISGAISTNSKGGNGGAEGTFHGNGGTGGGPAPGQGGLFTTQDTDTASGGGGGGHATNGGAGGIGYREWNLPGGSGGGSVGTNDLKNMNIGSGGGGGANYFNAYPAGSGGGIVFITGSSVNVAGSISSNGDDGVSPQNWQGSGGGAGSGGSLLFIVKTGTFGSSTTATGGAPGVQYYYDGTQFHQTGGGGAGGTGRIHIDYCESLSGYTNPTADTRKLNCYAVEQIESSPYNQGRLDLPENVNGSRTYKVQYGRKLNYSSAGSQMTTLRVPAGMFNTVSLDALVSGLSGNTLFSIDVGNNGSVDWTATVGSASTTTNGNLAAAFNAYWSSQGAPSAGTLDVPISVTLGGAGQVLLTNLQTQMSSSMLRNIRLGAQPYSAVSVNYTVGGSGSGPMTIAADVGDNGSIDWTWTGSVAFPYTANSGDLVTATNAYLSGKSGDVDVPIRFYVSPATATLTLNNYSATPAQLPDAAIAATSIGFSEPSIVESDHVTVALIVSNTGGSLLNGLIASLSGTTPDGALTYIGSALVPVIAPNGSATVNVAWNTLGYTGSVPVRVTLDPYGRVSETTKANNVVSATVNIFSRPQLDVLSMTLSDDEPVVGEPVTVALVLRNLGQTTTGSQTTALYQGNPDASAPLIDSRVVPPLAGGMTTTVNLTWVPTATGSFRLFARADRDRQVNQPDRSGNDIWRDGFVGFRGPILLDSGAAGDVAYSPATGYGYVDVGQTDYTYSCGSEPYQSLRNDPGGRVVYQFDHLQPHHYYHLDVTLYRCGFSSRQELVQVNNNTVAGPENLGDGKVHRLSILLDPALYAERSISVGIQVTNSVLGALVSQVNLYDVDYRYADAGGANDPAYPGARAFGWLNGVGLGNDPLPAYSQRMEPLGNQVSYRFDNLIPGKLYQLKTSFWQPLGSGDVTEKLQVNGADVGSPFTIGSGSVVSQVVDVPAIAYSVDGTITATVVRTDADFEAFINEIALEELTAVLPPVPLFSAAPITGYVPLGVQFTDQSSGMVTSRRWDFGDGYTDTVTNPLHIYNAIGAYTVTLATAGPGGSSVLTRSNLITVTAVPANIAVMRVTPVSATVNAGAPVTIGIELSNVTNLGSFQFTLGYNPALVEVQAVSLGDFLGSTGSSVIQTGPTINNAAGTATFGAGTLGSLAGPNGKGTVALVRLVPHGSGNAVLHLSDATATDVLANPFSLAVQDGTLSILSCLGDFNGNGIIDIIDVQRVAYRWNSHLGDLLYDPLYDLNGDGVINIVDVQYVAGRWNTRCGAMQQPAKYLMASGQPVTLSLLPLTQTVLAGQVFTVSVAISNAADLGAFDFNLTYSPTVVEIVTATLTGFLSSTGRTVVQTGPDIDAIAGTLAFGAFSLGSTPDGPSGDGQLAQITLRAVATGQTGLAFNTANVSDHSGSPMTTAIQDGTVSVAVTQMVYVPIVSR